MDIFCCCLIHALGTEYLGNIIIAIVYPQATFNACSDDKTMMTMVMVKVMEMMR